VTEPEFWEIIEQVKAASTDAFAREDQLKKLLSQKTPDQLEGFAETYQDLVIGAYSWPLWGAAYVISGGCSDDGFDYFRDWLISEGQETYKKALADPESLAELDGLEEPELEGFRYIADEVYEAKTGKPMKMKARDYPGDPSGEAWDEDTVDKQFPKLAAKYW